MPPRLPDRAAPWLFWASLAAFTLLAWVPPSWLAMGGTAAGGDKLLHLAAWCWLASLAFWARPGGWSAITTAAGLAVWSAAVESVQYLLPQRSFEWADMLANLVGIALALAIRQLALRTLGARNA